MSLFHLAILALIQGITEFLPISSSGHLILVPQIADVPDQGLLIDAAVHVGTLAAVMIYFWRDVGRMVGGVAQLVAGRGTPAARLALHLIVATVPVAIVGYVARDHVGAVMRSAEIVAWATLVFGIVLYIADRVGMTILRLEHLGIGHAGVIGLAQILALIPGTSRSGITMTAARLLGYERQEAARFSMLMSIPVIAGAGIFVGLEIRAAGDLTLGRDAIVAAVLSFVAALVSIWFLMAWVRRASLTIFAVYRLILGAGLLYWLYS